MNIANNRSLNKVLSTNVLKTVCTSVQELIDHLDIFHMDYWKTVSLGYCDIVYKL